MYVFPPFNHQKKCRYGTMLYNIRDQYIGQSLHQYGEFSEGEIELFRQAVKPGHHVIEVGANIGAHTVWFARAVGLDGCVRAFEPQRVVFQTLCANLAINHITNVVCTCAAVGNAPGQTLVPMLDTQITNNHGALSLGGHIHGEETPVLTIDDLNLSKCDFLKIDVEGMEQEVLEGAAKTIATFTPVIYVENDRKDKSDALVRCIDRLGYNMYWHTPLLFNPNNYAGLTENIFGEIASINMLCLPKTVPQQVNGSRPVEIPPDSPHA